LSERFIDFGVTLDQWCPIRKRHVSLTFNLFPSFTLFLIPASTMCYIYMKLNLRPADHRSNTLWPLFPLCFSLSHSSQPRFFVPLLGSAHPSRHFFFKQKGARWRERGVIWYYKFLTGIYIHGCESKVRPPSLFNSTLSNIVSQSLIFLTLLHTGWWTLCETLLHQILNGLN